MKKSILLLFFLVTISQTLLAEGGFCYSGGYPSGNDGISVSIFSDGVLESGFHYVKAEFKVIGKPEKTIKTTFFCKLSSNMMYFGKSSDEIRMDNPDGIYYGDGSFNWTNPRFLFYPPPSGSGGILLGSCGVMGDYYKEADIVEYTDADLISGEAFISEGDVEIPPPVEHYSEAEWGAEDAPVDKIIADVAYISDVEESSTFVCGGKTYEGEVVDFSDESPSYPGGEVAMSDFIRRNIVYPEQAKEEGVQGNVYIQFIVLPDGSLCDIQVVKGIPALNAEALRVISAMPKWIPGKQAGSVVAVRYTVPIAFRLN
jgi:TonB family protein